MAVIIITLVTGIIGEKGYAQTIIEDKQKLKDNFILSRNTEENKNTDQFIVDNNIYKSISDRDKNEVMFLKCGILNKNPKLTIKNTIDYNGENFKVKYIYENAFQDNNKDLKNIIIEDGILGFCDEKGNYVEKLNKTFCNKTKLESIDFGEAKVVFDDQCFENCNALSNIKIPDIMHNMSTRCFNNCFAINNVDISGISRFNGNGIFRNCFNLQSIGEFNDDLIELPDETFSGCSNFSIDNLKNITKLGSKCFSECNISNPNIALNVKEIGDNCFYKCYFKEINLNKAEKIGLNAFGACGSLAKVKFGNPLIPTISGVITDGNRINEWIYPLDYRNQKGYINFLDKLRISEVVWDANYGDNKEVVTNAVKLNSLEAPIINREGYKLTGWYKEPECINEVNMIADLAITSGSDLVIKDPKLYAKWVCKGENKEESNSNDSKKDSGQEKPHDNSKETTGDVQKENDNNKGKPANSSDSKQPSNVQTEPKFENDKKLEDNTKKETNNQNSNKYNEDIDVNNSSVSNKLRTSHKKRKENKNVIDNSNKFIAYDFFTGNRCISAYFNGDENSVIGFNINGIVIPNNFCAYNYDRKLNKAWFNVGNNKIYTPTVTKKEM